MSPFDNVVVGKLRLKGKALDVKSGGMKRSKRNKHRKLLIDNLSGGNASSMDLADGRNEAADNGNNSIYDQHLTPAERRFIEQTEKLEFQRLSKIAAKSHRDRVQEFNQYLANLSEHYDIPKVGPG